MSSDTSPSVQIAEGTPRQPGRGGLDEGETAMRFPCTRWLSPARPTLSLARRLAAEALGTALAFSEGVATFGLVLTILGAARFRPEQVPILVGFT